MQEEVYEADAALHKAETTTLFSLQQTNAELELKVAQYEEEIELRKQAQEKDRQFHHEDKARMHRQIEKLDEMNRKY